MDSVSTPYDTFCSFNVMNHGISDHRIAKSRTREIKVSVWAWHSNYAAVITGPSLGP